MAAPSQGRRTGDRSRWPGRADAAAAAEACRPQRRGETGRRVPREELPWNPCGRPSRPRGANAPLGRIGVISRIPPHSLRPLGQLRRRGCRLGGRRAGPVRSRAIPAGRRRARSPAVRRGGPVAGRAGPSSVRWSSLRRPTGARGARRLRRISLEHPQLPQRPSQRKQEGQDRTDDLHPIHGFRRPASAPRVTPKSIRSSGRVPLASPAGRAKSAFAGLKRRIFRPTDTGR
jgi:hypothetical protein